MLQVPDFPLILSASRTKDMVHRSPDLLADILLGRAPCRWGPHGPFGYVQPESLHSVVLWTKDPRPLLFYNPLRATLFELINRFKVQISLQVTATGLGGSFIEPGIPSWQEVHAAVVALLTEGWILPEAMVYRFDPFLRVETPGGGFLSNARMEVFKPIASTFLDLGIKRITTSRAEAVRYPKVLERFQKLGLEWIRITEVEALNLCHEMNTFCQSLGAEFSVCCDPYSPELSENWGCIDARWLNKIKRGANPALEILHNRIGKQRPTCQCTYSRDIGYSTGSATCYSGGFGCLYCYAQGNAQPPGKDQLLAEISDFDKNPVEYYSHKGLLHLQ